MSKVAVRLDQNGTLTTYSVDRKGNVHPKTAIQLNGEVVTTFPMIARNLASIQEGAVTLLVLEAKRIKKKKKKKQQAKMRARRRTT